MLMIREGSSEHNLHDLLPLVDRRNLRPLLLRLRRPRLPHRSCTTGHLDDILRQAIAAGLDPVPAIRMATWNAADYWRLDGIGAVAPGYRSQPGDPRRSAHGQRLDDDLQRDRGRPGWRIRSAAAAAQMAIPDPLARLGRLAPLRLTDLRLAPEDARIAVETYPRPDRHPRDRRRAGHRRRLGGCSDPSRDLLKLVCVERHDATGRVGVGLRPRLRTHVRRARLHHRPRRPQHRRGRRRRRRISSRLSPPSPTARAGWPPSPAVASWPTFLCRSVASSRTVPWTRSPRPMRRWKPPRAASEAPSNLPSDSSRSWPYQSSLRRA